MIIRHSLPTKHFTRIDRFVFELPELSDAACRLYGFLCGLRNGANFSDTYILNKMEMSQSKLTRLKKELKDHQLILQEQLAPRLYVLYIGHTKLTGEEVKQRWKTEDAHDKTNYDKVASVTSINSKR